MAWHGILGHDDVVGQFRQAIGWGRLASSFLFSGPAGIGKMTFAVKLGQSLLCPERPEAALDPCETCPSCLQVAARTHPDLEIVAKPEEKSFLPLELFIGDKEHRMKEGLCHRIAMKPFQGGRKIAVIDDADFLNAEGANCLLKTLEEPPPQSLLILIGTSPAKQLPTIRSRCQLIRFRPLRTDQVEELLLSRGLVAEPAEARRLAAHSEGSLQRALELADAELWDFRDKLHQRLAEPLMDGVALAATVMALVEGAGKEASAKRQRMRQMARFTADFYRAALRQRCGAPANDDGHRVDPLAATLRGWPGDAEMAAACLERTLDAADEIQRNVHPATLVECWFHDLTRIMQPARSTSGEQRKTR
jgi:DNA polymerase-3 subunit delta'